MADQILKFPANEMRTALSISPAFCFLTIAFGADASEVEELKRLHACLGTGPTPLRTPNRKKTSVEIAGHRRVKGQAGSELVFSRS
jgi:hypothetical protein